MKEQKITNLLKQAAIIAENSHDIERKVGAILVHNKTGAILATGFNGFVRKAPDQDLPKSGSAKHNFMIHAEENLICNAARHGIVMDDCTLICTLSPCAHCLRLLHQCGITTIYFKERHKTIHDTLSVQDLKVSCITYYTYFKLTIKEKTKEVD